MVATTTFRSLLKLEYPQELEQLALDTFRSLFYWNTLYNRAKRLEMAGMTGVSIPLPLKYPL